MLLLLLLLLPPFHYHCTFGLHFSCLPAFACYLSSSTNAAFPFSWACTDLICHLGRTIYQQSTVQPLHCCCSALHATFSILILFFSFFCPFLSFFLFFWLLLAVHPCHGQSFAGSRHSVNPICPSFYLFTFSLFYFFFFNQVFFSFSAPSCSIFCSISSMTTNYQCNKFAFNFTSAQFIH